MSAAGYAQMLDWTTRLNTPGEALGAMPEVHAITDVTGFGLAGHLLEMCRGASLGAEVRFDALPVIGEALDWVKQGVATGASDRNWKGYGHEVDFQRRGLEAQAALGSADQRRVAGRLRAGR